MVLQESWVLDGTIEENIAFGRPGATHEEVVAAAKMAGCSDGAIVGSAIIRLLEKYGKDAAGPVEEYVRSMKDAVRACDIA